MLSFRTLVAVAALVAAVLGAPDQCANLGEADCLKQGDYTACAWCPTPAGSAQCLAAGGAKPLPAGCGTASRNDCNDVATTAACEQIIGCAWCTSFTVKPACRNYENASHLPKSVFTCTL